MGQPQKRDAVTEAGGGDALRRSDSEIPGAGRFLEKTADGGCWGVGEGVTVRLFIVRHAFLLEAISFSGY